VLPTGKPFPIPAALPLRSNFLERFARLGSHHIGADEPDLVRQLAIGWFAQRLSTLTRTESIKSGQRDLGRGYELTRTVTQRTVMKKDICHTMAPRLNAPGGSERLQELLSNQTNILRADKSIAHKVTCLANRYRNTDQCHNILILQWIF
jgi:hypothetical protein